MAIEINPNRLNVSSGVTGKTSGRTSQQGAGSSSLYKAPTRSDVNYIPGKESLATLIGSAVEAQRNGVTWERGTILNLVV